MEYRPVWWDAFDIYTETERIKGFEISGSDLVEAGASAMGEHILSLLKDKAPSSVIIDILEGKR